ncbi:hypothetical protein [Aureivirga sp. CE67]|uniref:hypothetical protein n=1 Tax=Aureivirga sp. CE67 TaxID=1788983 RepID=UPI0018CB6647|nr:hypothetical protein [Aureivirga sp. CE67]
MKKIFKDIGIIVLFGVLFVLIMDVWLRNQNSVYKAKLSGLEKEVEDIELLILGNSRAGYGINPTLFDQNAYNLANVSQSIYFDRRITEKYLDQMNNLKYVFLSIDYHTLYFSSQGRRDYWSYYAHDIKHPDRSYTMPTISPFLYGYSSKPSMAMLKRSVINNLSHNDSILDFDVENGINIEIPMQKGFITYENTDKDAFNKIAYEARAKYFNGKTVNSNEKEDVLKDLEDFIQLLKDKNIQPVLITSPCIKEFRDLLDEKIKAQNEKDIAYLVEKYGLPYFNYFNGEEYFEKDEFYNCDHLNLKGAEKFATLLNKKLKDFK